MLHDHIHHAQQVMDYRTGDDLHILIWIVIIVLIVKVLKD